MRKNLKRYFLNKKTLLFGLLIACFCVLSFIHVKQTYSEKTTSTTWDGTIATSFSEGTGTQADPFIISDGSELAYFFELINGSDSSTYFNKYYEITNNINLNNFDFSQINTEKTFSGHINGNGYIISNFSLNTCHYNTIDSVSECALFHELANADVQNITFNNISLNINTITANTRISFLADRASNTTIRNVSISNLEITSGTNPLYTSYIAGIVNTDNRGNNVNNVHISLDATPDTQSALLIYTYTNSTIGTIVNRTSNLPLSRTGTINVTPYTYTESNNNIVFTNNYPISSVLEILNSNSSLEWTYSNNILRMRNSGTNEVEEEPSTITEHTSGVEDGVVYVNDLVADQNYYNGLNFTYSTNRAFPTTENKNIYTENNLVKVQATYNGKDYLKTQNNATGYEGNVSASESYNKLVYYKIYPVNDNGTSSDTSDDYVEFDLIDNPFAKRPNNKAFNGWSTTNNNAIITIDRDIYVRKVKIPVTYTDGIPDDVVISFYASWTAVKTYTMTGNTNWSTAINSLNSEGLMRASGTDSGYHLENYYYSTTVNRNTNYQIGDFYQRNFGGNNRRWILVTNSNTTCTTNGGCTVYRPAAGTEYSSSRSYYTITEGTYTNGGVTYTTGTFTRAYPSYTNVTYNNLTYGESSAGYYRKKTIPNGGSIVGFYTAALQRIDSGTCTTPAGCTYYEFINALDSSGNPEIANENEEYYFLVTRDTNVIVMGGNITSLWTTANQSNKPFTFTAINNSGQDNSASYYWSVGGNNLNVGADTRIEWIRIGSNQTFQTNNTVNQTTSILCANLYNLKIGRGIKRYNNNNATFSIVSGADSFSGSSNQSYTLIIESGYYNNLSLSTTYNSSNATYVITAYGTYGNDIDRVQNINNNLDIRYCASGSYYRTVSAASTNDIALNTLIKSGIFGSNRADYASGVYIGGRGNGSQNTLRKGTIEGGVIHNLIGGPFSQESYVKSGNTYLNDTLIYVKGGTIDVIIGGAGVSATYGNRIVQVTGGQVNYAVAGGSNGVAASDTAKLNGDTYVYIGGNAKIGNDNITVGTLENSSQIESGSVFGAGNGSSSNSTYGSVNNSTIVIADDATIKGNVYGGGNYGGTGINNTTTYNPANTTIKILDGTIEGSVYGGANRNGAGRNNVTGNINISMYDGEVDGGIYGGSNISGIVYGSTNVNVYGGDVHDIFGGGQGADTYVRDNVAVVIGQTGVINEPVVTGNIYGGSAYGTVNATSRNAAANNNTTTVTVNNGNITGQTVGDETVGGSVFGGAKGSSTYTPYVKGNITVNINGGTINNVYGGFDDAGTPQGTDYVYLNGGIIGKSFGGGNNTSQTTTNIYLQGAQTEYLFGGSNNNGDVTTANVTITSGTATYAFGGNNLGGSCATTNVNMSSGTIANSLFGGGNAVATTTTNVTITGATNTIPYAYGGGNQAGVTNATNITTSNASISNLYGGSNQSGDVATTNLTINSGNVTKAYGGNNSGGNVTQSHVKVNNGTVGKVYGGNNIAGSTTTTEVVVENGDVTSIFGGGSQTSCTTTNVTLKGGTIGTAFGGSDSSGNITNTYISATNANGNLQVTNIYGGNNEGGVTATASTSISGGDIGNVYGGGYQATTTTPTTTITGGEIGNVFGGGNQAIISTNTTLNISGGTMTNVYGGGNNAGVNGNTNVTISGGTINNNTFGGGNNGVVSGNTNVVINDATILGSAYAGGNGADAVVIGNTNIYIGGDTVVGSSGCSVPHQGSVFGGGNAAFTGTSGNNNSHAKVEIAGGTFYGNVYGGANTSVVYGNTTIDIGKTTTSNAIRKDDIHIYGTVFGAGEANASGSEVYDFDFISVTSGVVVNIDAEDYDNFLIDGSIFGSGNASTSDGDSIVTISNYGTLNNPKVNISIQRATVLTINNSSIRLKGASDRTNEYSDVLFGFSRIDSLIIRDGTALYLDSGCNLVKEFNSQTSTGLKAAVVINQDGTLSKNVDNRLYALQGTVINILTSQQLTDYGNVNGMTFFGMYKVDNNSGVISKGIYGDYATGATLPTDIIFDTSSYVLGAHKTDHDIEVDGFYSNFADDNNINTIKYIDPTPPSADFYMWVIGEGLLEYEVNLVASKYSTLGTTELSMLELSDPNTTFDILEFDYTELEEGVSLIHKNDIPRIAETDTLADTRMGLAIESSTSGWLTNGQTSFVSSTTHPVIGTETYVGDNSTDAPSFLIYLYHSKNLSSNGDLGTAKIYLQATTQIDDLTKRTVKLVIKVNISRILYTTNDYEAAITPGRKYELFTTTTTNITSKSSISAYFALFATADIIER